MLDIAIDLGNGNIEHILANENDDPQKMVRNICLKYGLDENQRIILINLIKKGIEDELKTVHNELTDIETEKDIISINIPILKASLHKRIKNNEVDTGVYREEVTIAQQRVSELKHKLHLDNEEELETPFKISSPRCLVSRLSGKKQTIKEFDNEVKKEHRGVYLYKTGVRKRLIRKFHAECELEKRYHEEMKESTFKPLINKARHRSEGHNSYRSRQDEYKLNNETLTGAKRFEKLFKDASYKNLLPKKYRINRNCTFVPNMELTRNYNRNISFRRSPLYQSLTERPEHTPIKIQLKDSSNIKALNRSNTIINQSMTKGFAFVFNLLDSDVDGVISADSISLDKLPKNVSEIFMPIIKEMKEMACLLNVEEFIDACKNLFSDVNYLQKKEFYDYYKRTNRHSLSKFTFEVLVIKSISHSRLIMVLLKIRD